MVGATRARTRVFASVPTQSANEHNSASSVWFHRLTSFGRSKVKPHDRENAGPALAGPAPQLQRLIEGSVKLSTTRYATRSANCPNSADHIRFRRFPDIGVYCLFSSPPLCAPLKKCGAGRHNTPAPHSITQAWFLAQGSVQEDAQEPLARPQSAHCQTWPVACRCVACPT